MTADTPKVLTPFAPAAAARVRARRSMLLDSGAVPAPDRFLTAREVGLRLGVHVKTVLRYVRRAGLPACRLPGGDLRFAWPEVSRWLTERKEIRT
jgi:excisionase family DNA binding protein